MTPILVGRRPIGDLYTTANAGCDRTEFLARLACAFAPVIQRAQVEMRLADSARQLTRLRERDAITSQLTAGAAAEARMCIRRAAATLGDAAQTERRLSRRELMDMLEELASADRAVRRAAGGVRYLPRTTGSLASSLRALAADFGAATGIAVAVQTRGEPFPLDRTVEDALCLLAVEWLLTAELDGRASEVVILLAYGNAHVAMALRDDGAGLVHRPAFGQPWAVRSLQRAIEGDGGEFRVTNIFPRGVEVVASFASSVRA